MIKGIESLATQGSGKPNQTAYIRYLFWTQGIGESEFNNCSLPYILEILSTHNYVEKEKAKAEKKASRKR